MGGMESWILLYFIQFIDNPNSKTGNNTDSNNNIYRYHYSIDNLHLNKDCNKTKHVILGIIESMKHQMERIGMTHWRNGNNNSTIDNDTRINHDDHHDDLNDAGRNITGKTDDSLDFLVNPGLCDLDNDLMYPNFTDLDIDMGNTEANNNNGKRRSESQDSINKLPLRTNNNTLSVDGIANTRGMPLSY